MPVQLASLVAAQYAPSSAGALYTSPSGVTTRIDSLSVTNVTSSTAQITLYLVPSGGSAGSSTTTTLLQAVLPNQTWNSPNEVGKVLGPGGALYALASAADALVIVAGGLQAS